MTGEPATTEGMGVLSKRWPRIALAVAALVAITYGWASWTLESERERHRVMVVRMASGLSHALKILVDTWPAERVDDQLQSILDDRLGFRRPFRYIEIRRGHDVVASLTNPNPPPHPETGLVEVRFTLQGPAERVEAVRPHPGEPGRPPPWVWTPSRSSAVALELSVGLDETLPPSRERGVMRRLITIGTLAWFLIAAVWWAWARRLRARELARTLEREQSELRRLTDLNLAASGLAHETKNPLGIIRGVAQRLASSPVADDATRASAEVILEEADRAASRLGDFLNFAHLPTPSWETVPARVVIQRLVDVLRPDFDAAGVTLTCDVGELHIRCDRDMLEQLVVNLLLNSLEACGRVPHAPMTHLGLEGVGQTATLTVTDTGAGMPSDLLARVFRPYVTGRADGHGLGLAVVKRICEQHRWEVTMTSEPGRGTTVIVSGLAIGPSPEGST